MPVWEESRPSREPLHPSVAEGAPVCPPAQVRNSRVHGGIPPTADHKKLWAYAKRNTDLFRNVVLDRKSGFDELGELFGPGRYLSALLSVFFFFCNFYYIIGTNVRTIWSSLQSKHLQGRESFMLTRHLMKRCFGVEVDASVCIAILELTLGLTVLVYILVRVAMVCKPRNEIRRWMSVSNIFFVAIPLGTKISAVKLLNWVTPQVIESDFFVLLERISREGCRRNAGQFCWFLFTRILCLFIGLDAFLIKFQTMAFLLYEANKDHLYKGSLILSALAFLNQMLGVADVGMFTWQRLFVFVFGGEKGFLSSIGESKMRIWESMLVQGVWRLEGLKRRQALAIFLSFSDADLQKLALDTRSQSCAGGEDSCCGGS